MLRNILPGAALCFIVLATAPAVGHEACGGMRTEVHSPNYVYSPNNTDRKGYRFRTNREGHDCFQSLAWGIQTCREMKDVLVMISKNCSGIEHFIRPDGRIEEHFTYTLVEDTYTLVEDPDTPGEYTAVKDTDTVERASPAVGRYFDFCNRQRHRLSDFAQRCEDTCKTGEVSWSFHSIFKQGASPVSEFMRLYQYSEASEELLTVGMGECN